MQDFIVDEKKYYPHAVTVPGKKPNTFAHVVVQTIADHKEKYPEDFDKFQREVGSEPPPDHEKMVTEERARGEKALADERARVEGLIKASGGIPIEHRKTIMEVLKTGVPLTKKDERSDPASEAASAK